MTFAQPAALFALLLLPLVAAAYVWVQKRRRRYTLRYSSLSLLADAAASRSALRRHLPAGLYVLMLAALVLAAARPSATIVAPESSGIVILAIDVSGSMRNNDIAPSRIDAAKAAVRTFVNTEPKGIKIGVVAFSNSALLVTPPTGDRKQVLTAVNILPLTRGTNIGDGLRVALEAISYLDADARESPDVTEPPPLRAPAVSPTTATIVLLSDGASTTGPNPLGVADEIAAAGFKVHTVGIGTRQVSSFQGGGRFMQLDDATLKGIASTTGGKYYSAQNAGELREIYGNIAKEHRLAQHYTDITFAFAAIALLFLLAAVTLGAVWLGRLP